jgi:peptide/nickel transport system substrate-binding protein
MIFSTVLTLSPAGRGLRAAFVLLLAACQALPAIGTPAPSAARAGGTLRVALPAEITSLDPWNADAASLVAVRQMYETLVIVDPATGSLAPGLASSWQMTNDGATWTFVLRQGVRFHDGTPFDAGAVAASFERARNTKDSRRGGDSYASYRALFGGFDDASAIARVQPIDAATLRIDLRAPYGPFLAHLAAPQTAIAHGTAGTGPFRAAADALAPDGTLTLTRNDAYWRRDPAGGAALPYLEGLILRPVRDAGSRLVELRSGRIDLALDLPVAQAAAARSDPSLVLVPRREAALASLGIDATAPPFDRPEARRAIALAIDRSALTGVYSGLARNASQVVPAGTLGYDDSVVEFSPLDTAAARRLLTDARIATPLTVELAYPAGPTAAYPDPQRIAQSLAADLAKIGIVARLRAFDADVIGDVPAALALETTPIGLDPDDVFWPLFGPQSENAAAGSLVIGLLRKARAEAEVSKRAELYKQVSKIARTEALGIPLMLVDRANAASGRLAGYAAISIGTESFGTVWLRP